jgi:plastocyanin
MTTRPLSPRVPEPERPWRPRPALPRVALFAFLTAVLAAAAAGLLASPAVIRQEQAAAAHYSVRIANFAFSPAAVTVSPGDTITWTNEDSAPHTVTTSSGPQALNSPTLSQGQSWSYTFSAVGTYGYYCAVHPDMRAEVIVQAAATAVTTKPQTHAPQTTSAQTKTSHPAAAAQPQTTTAAPASSAPPGSSASASGTGASPTASTTTVAAVAAGETAGLETLSPALLLGGLTAAVAVFCLLLVASRSARERDRAPAEPDES